VAEHIYTQALHRRTQIKTDNTNNDNRTTQIQTNVVKCGPCLVFASFTLEFALQLRKKHEIAWFYLIVYPRSSIDSEICSNFLFKNSYGEFNGKCVHFLVKITEINARNGKYEIR
jgi:hypothetical protein